MEAAVAYPIFAQQNYANPRSSVLKRMRAQLRRIQWQDRLRELPPRQQAH